MKLLMCGSCMDIHSLPPDGEWGSCRCGNASARWLDSTQGTVEVRAADRSKVRIIGMHNGFLRGAYWSEFYAPPVYWRELHETICQEADGYLFHADKRCCWACVIQVGESNDVFWAADEPPTSPPPTGG